MKIESRNQMLKIPMPPNIDALESKNKETSTEERWFRKIQREWRKKDCRDSNLWMSVYKKLPETKYGTLIGFIIASKKRNTEELRPGLYVRTNIAQPDYNNPYFYLAVNEVCPYIEGLLEIPHVLPQNNSRARSIELIRCYPRRMNSTVFRINPLIQYSNRGSGENHYPVDFLS